MTQFKRPRMPKLLATQYVAFNLSAAGGLSLAFEKLNRRELVLGLPDDLSFGPINPASYELRSEWNQRVLGYDADDCDYGLPDKDLWAIATSRTFKPVALVHRRSAREYCNFLEFISRLGGASCYVIYIDELNLTVSAGKRQRPSRSSGELSVESLCSIDFDSCRVDLSSAVNQAYSCAWTKLKQENAPLRIINEYGLASAQMDHFDSIIMELLTDQWVCAAWVIGETMSRGPFDQVSPYVLWPRLISLCESGIIEGKGNMTYMWGSYLRKIVPTSI